VVATKMLKQEDNYDRATKFCLYMHFISNLYLGRNLYWPTGTADKQLRSCLA